MEYYNIPYTAHMYYKADPESLAAMKQHSPNLLAPVLEIVTGDKSLLVADSLAICETLAELYPWLPLWPTDPHQRALARMVACEMHSSFASLRNEMPMNIDLKIETVSAEWKPETLSDIKRVEEIWNQCRANVKPEEDEGFLFGRFSIADAMFVPVVFRFNSYYGIDNLSLTSKQYCCTILEMGAIKRLRTEAALERKEHPIPSYEGLYSK
jgi:glutathione S-transferase